MEFVLETVGLQWKAAHTLKKINSDIHDTLKFLVKLLKFRKAGEKMCIRSHVFRKPIHPSQTLIQTLRTLLSTAFCAALQKYALLSSHDVGKISATLIRSPASDVLLTKLSFAFFTLWNTDFSTVWDIANAGPAH